MPKKQNTNHIVIGKDERQKDYFGCNHCGEKLFYELPLRVDTWVNMSKSFTSTHKDCKPRPVKES